MRAPWIRGALVVALAVAAGPVAFGTTDREIQDSAEGALRASIKTSHLRLDVEVEQGIATLSGRVRTLGQSWDAENVVAAVRGVLDIHNQIEVDAGGRQDDSIANDLERRFENIPALDAAGLDVKVSEGRVTLIGEVKDARLRFRAREAAAEINGVVAVLDEIATPATEDDSILKGLRNLFGRGSLVRVAGAIRPSVEDGVVTLEGRVPRLSEKRQAERLAWGVNGVRGVANQLEVRPRGIRFR